MSPVAEPIYSHSGRGTGDSVRRLRVLVANIPAPHNRFLSDLNDALSKRCSLLQSSDAFWTMSGEYDIVHLHWPEYLTYEIESAYVNGLPQSLVDEVEKRLRYWSERAKVIVTRHNIYPHDAPADPAWTRMYETVYRHADGVVHLARVSKTDFQERYREMPFARGVEPRHEIIPIQNYSSLPNDVGRDEARRELAISRTSRVVLVFGAIRNDAERALIIAAFRDLHMPRKLLLVSQWRENLASVSWIRLKYWLRDLARLYHSVHPQHHFGYDYVEEAMTQVYLNAADLLFIPRIDALSSANVSLGFTFGKVVVGPSTFNPGELLSESGNPVFDPASATSASHALALGFRLADEGLLGEKNRVVAFDKWDPDSSAAKYVRFYETVVGAHTTPSRAEGIPAR